MSSLEAILSIPIRERLPHYQSYLQSLLSASPIQVPPFLDFIEEVTQDSIGIVISRQCLEDYVNGLKELGKKNARDEDNMNKIKSIIQGTLERLGGSGVSFEEQIFTLRLQLADIFESGEEWNQAAKALQAMPVESTHRTVPDSQKLEIYIRIVRLLLEDDDTVPAETYLNRAALLIRSSNDKMMQLNFKLCQARIFDSKRMFVEAGLRYHEISFVTEVEEEERLKSLSAALSCAVLAPAGPPRSRLLGALYRDDRIGQIPHHSILTKMFLDHIIQPSEVQDFSAGLAAHQLAKLPPNHNVIVDEDRWGDVGSNLKNGPENVLDRAVMEHNLLSASKIYNSITFPGLGLLLNLKPSAAELMARGMIQQGRLKGRIDQVEGLILFDPVGIGKDDGVVSNVAAKGDKDKEGGEFGDDGAKETLRWDLQIRQTANQVEEIAIRIGALRAVTGAAS